MGEYFNRAFALTIGTVRIASETIDGEPNRPPRITFEVERTTKREPNTAKIAIFNLREDTRALIRTKGIPTILEAGYAGQSSQIFSGALEYGSTTREGSDWIMRFESTDGGKQTRAGRMNISFKPGLNIGEVLRKSAEALGVGLGNVLEKAQQGNVRGALQEFGNGIVLSGPATKQFDKIAKTLGYEWSIQDGQLQLLEANGAIDATRPVKLSATTGLIGTPQSGEDGKLDVRALLSPRLLPGRLVNIDALEIQGFFRIERVVFKGDTRGAPWFAELEVKPR